MQRDPQGKRLHFFYNNTFIYIYIIVVFIQQGFVKLIEKVIVKIDIVIKLLKKCMIFYIFTYINEPPKNYQSQVPNKL